MDFPEVSDIKAPRGGIVSLWGFSVHIRVLPVSLREIV
jgi:hypothetical protein